LVVSGGVASGTVVSGGAQHVDPGGTAIGTTVSGGEQDVFSGGVVSGTVVSGGAQVVSSGGMASGTVVSGGYLFISAGGVVSGLDAEAGSIVQDAGRIALLGGDVAIAVAVLAGGTLVVTGVSATTASATVSSGGAAFVSSGGTASDLGIAAGGTAFVGDGAALSGTLTDDGALVATETGTLQISAEIDGTGAVAQAGPGTLVLEGGANGYSGGTTISAGTLQLDGRGAAGTGAITFEPGANAILRLDVSPLPTNTISGFGPGDAIDLPGLLFDATDTVIAKGNIVTITTSSGATYHLVIAGAGTQGGYALVQAPEGGTRLTTANTPVTVSSMRGVDAGKGLQFLGGTRVPAVASAVALGAHESLGRATPGLTLAALLHKAAGPRDLAASMVARVGTAAAVGENGGNSPLLPDTAASIGRGIAGSLYASAGGLSPMAAGTSGFANMSAGLG
jgi:autotransporter passenger strand-loop-strand repeat protein/autotransporter-associated beta strand protein